MEDSNKYFVLTKDIDVGIFSTDICVRGTLLIKIKTAGFFQGSADKYKVATQDKEIGLKIDDVCQLSEETFHILLALSSNKERDEELLYNNKTLRLDVAEKVLAGSKVSVELEKNEFTNGTLMYKGPMKDKRGTYFGIHLEKAFGDSNGAPHFTCEENRAVFVPVNKLTFTDFMEKKKLHVEQNLYETIPSQVIDPQYYHEQAEKERQNEEYLKWYKRNYKNHVTNNGFERTQEYGNNSQAAQNNMDVRKRSMDIPDVLETDQFKDDDLFGGGSDYIKPEVAIHAGDQLVEGSTVKVHLNMNNTVCNGVIRWKGRTELSENTIGVELEIPEGNTDGKCMGIRKFRCEENYGIFVRSEQCKLYDKALDEFGAAGGANRGKRGARSCRGDGRGRGRGGATHAQHDDTDKDFSKSYDMRAAGGANRGKRGARSCRGDGRGRGRGGATHAQHDDTDEDFSKSYDMRAAGGANRGKRGARSCRGDGRGRGRGGATHAQHDDTDEDFSKSYDMRAAGRANRGKRGARSCRGDGRGRGRGGATHAQHDDTDEDFSKSYDMRAAGGANRGKRGARSCRGDGRGRGRGGATHAQHDDTNEDLSKSYDMRAAGGANRGKRGARSCRGDGRGRGRGGATHAQHDDTDENFAKSYDMPPATLNPSEDAASIDSRSVFVRNVDYSATEYELKQHFHECGSVNRVTIPLGKSTRRPQGFAFIEFGDKESVENAFLLTASLFKGRQIEVRAKRTNVPGISSTNRGHREIEVGSELKLQNLKKQSPREASYRENTVGVELGQLNERTQQLQEKTTEIDNLITSHILLPRQQLDESRNNWLIDRAELELSEETIGRGEWGSVTKAKFRGTKVSVKKIHDLIVSPHTQDLFAREISMASRCRHPCLVQFIGATNDRTPLFVMELMQTDLRSQLGREALSKENYLHIGHDVSRALAYLHLSIPTPILHRDISSANVLLYEANGLWGGKLSDYGPANFMRQANTKNPGAVLYSAPESGGTTQTTKLDVYSFGVLFCEMIINDLPKPDKRIDQLYRIQNSDYRGLVARCISNDIDKRPSTPQIVEQFEEWKTPFL